MTCNTSATLCNAVVPHFWLLGLPDEICPNSIYFIKNGEEIQMYVTDKFSNPYLINEEAITSFHNELQGLQGGNTEERYHLTQAQHSAIVSAVAGGGFNLQSVTNAGNLTTNPIVIYSVADASVRIEDDNIQLTRRVDGVDKVTTVNFEAAEINHTLTIPAKNAPDTFAMLSDLDNGTPIPQDFFVSAPNRTSQFTNIMYVTDTLRFLDLSEIVPNFRNGKEIFRVAGTNDIIIAYTPAPTYISPIWFVKLPNCRVKDNILLFDTPITGSMPVSDLTHGSDIDDNYFYLSTRVQSANVNTLSTEIIKVNINNFSDVYSLTLPIADYKGMASELREYKESLYTLIHNPDTDITKLVKISKNFDKYETIASYGADVTNRSRIAIPFSIYNEEIIVPSNNWTNTTTQYNNYVINVFDLNGNLKRIKEVSLPGNPGVRLLSPHWMTVFNNKIIITPTGGGNALQDRYIVRIDAGLDSDNDSIVFEESKLVRTLISDDNSLFSTGYLIIGAETSSNPRPEAELIKMFYNDFTDLEVLATNYSAIAAIHPKFSTGIAKTKLSEFENDLVLSVGTLQQVTDNGNTIEKDDDFTIVGTIGGSPVMRTYQSSGENTSYIQFLAPASPTTNALYTQNSILSNNSGFSKAISFGIPTDNRSIEFPDASGQILTTAGTTAGNPVTGDIEFEDVTTAGNLGFTATYGDTTFSRYFSDNNWIEDKAENATQTGTILIQPGAIDYGVNTPLGNSSIGVSSSGVTVNADSPTSKGITGAQDFTANITDFDYTQKKYVDDAIDDAIGSLPSSSTNLTYTASPTGGTVNSDTGTDATIPLADTTNAGLLSPADKTKLNNTSGTNSGDNATNTTSNAYADGKVADAINDGVTTIAPSQNAVFDALFEKISLDAGSPTTVRKVWYGTQAQYNALGVYDPTVEYNIETDGKVSSVTFNGNAAPTYAAGSLVYDTANESLTFFNNDSAVALQIGQESWIRVRNDSGSTIPNGSVVYISGTHASGIPQISLAQANSATTTIAAGLTTESIANNTIGYVTSLGQVNNLNTSSFTAGATLFISPTVAGGLTATAPTAPNYRYRVGIVTKSNATTGSIHVTPSTAALGNGTANQIFGINNAGTAQEVKSIVGTANQITVTHSANTITLAGGWLSGSATLDFPSTAANATSDLTMTVTGAAVGDPVFIGSTSLPAASTFYSAYVSAANTVTVRFHNNSAVAVNPASGTFNARVFK